MSQFELRLAALSKLVDAKTAAVEERLSEEFSRVAKVLEDSAEYEELWEALKTLAVLVPRFHMATLPTLEKFVREVSQRTLAEGGAPISGSRLRYRSVESLIREAIEVADKVRYVHTEQLVDFLLEMSHAADKEVRAKAEGSLKALATFDLDVFYGQPPRGAEPQIRMVTHLGKLKDDELRANANVILQVLGTTLSPAIEGTSWSYQSITIRRGSVQSDGGVAAMRADAIELAKRMYTLDASVDYRMQVLRTLNTATRREGRVSNADTLAMFERDAIKVLEFARDLVKTEALPVVQSIEHLAYWDYYHADSQAIKDKALEVRDVLDAHSEYQIYKQLIGFEGIFGKWEDLSRSDGAWDYSDTKRREAARQYLEEINDATYEVWRDRILEFSKTRSNDLAMFPVYYDFLESIGRERSRLALEFLTIHEVVMAPFLIALMRGLWISGNVAEIDAIVKDWVASGRHLTTIAKSLYGVGAQRLDTLAAVIDRATALDDRDALIQTMGVAASLFAEGASGAKSIFLQSLRELAKHDDARWANVIWFRKDFRVLVGAMEPSERAEILAALTSLPELDYQVEDILYEIAQFDLHVVLSFLVGRLKHARALADKKREMDVGSSDQFEPIPYQLHKLGEAIAREPGMLLSALRGDFDEEVRFMFSYRGARLVKSAFPTFGAPLEGLLLQYVGTGGEDDIEFVVGILRAYDGSASILEVCKAIVKAVPERSGVWKEVAAAIETTGVVRGEYGLVQAYEQKLQAISAWKSDEDGRVQAFAQWLTEGLQGMIEHERQRAEEGLALRKYRYGAGKDEG
ncbi:hypothetical protein B7R77_12370 [Ralstonia solanacearum K60]|uniref:Uncharacterized protein n=1 Tax=Ralstonia solanacearum K60 TaxID=1091042 RepID=A0AAP7ZNR8_RALSL|nr:hypothetical protein [Ralstonia solanacearum]OYQ13961.1 hypothetical protein B7R77_12370 [Ralstonia solanacearum K60]CCF98288.1 hypothetical protein RSK60_480002 [Ralstonia solanacearum K60]